MKYTVPLARPAMRTNEGEIVYSLCEHCEHLICELDDYIGDYCELDLPLMEDLDCPYDCLTSTSDCCPCCKSFERKIYG